MMEEWRADHKVRWSRSRGHGNARPGAIKLDMLKERGMGDDRGFWGRQVVEDAFLKMNPTVMWDELRGRGSAGRETAPVHELVGVVRR